MRGCTWHANVRTGQAVGGPVHSCTVCTPLGAALPEAGRQTRWRMQHFFFVGRCVVHRHAPLADTHRVQVHHRHTVTSNTCRAVWRSELGCGGGGEGWDGRCYISSKRFMCTLSSGTGPVGLSVATRAFSAFTMVVSTLLSACTVVATHSVRSWPSAGPTVTPSHTHTFTRTHGQTHHSHHPHLGGARPQHGK